jgi:hypothetical protein
MLLRTMYKKALCMVKVTTRSRLRYLPSRSVQTFIRMSTLRTMNSDLNLTVQSLVIRYWQTSPDKTEDEEIVLILENKSATHLLLS